MQKPHDKIYIKSSSFIAVTMIGLYPRYSISAKTSTRKLLVSGRKIDVLCPHWEDETTYFREMEEDGALVWLDGDVRV